MMYVQKILLPPSGPPLLRELWSANTSGASKVPHFDKIECQKHFPDKF